MSDDMVMHFSSNQFDHSLPDKLAKLEARLTGKTASSAKPQPQQQLSVWSSASAVVASTVAGSSEVSISDSDDEWLDRRRSLLCFAQLGLKKISVRASLCSPSSGELHSAIPALIRA